MTRLDGKAPPRPLAELFRDDMTTALGRCAGCGDVSVLAEALVYDAAPGWAVRCHACGDVLMTFVRTLDRLRIDMRGLTALEIPA